MHAYRKFVQQQMDERGWTATELAVAGGLTKQTIHNIVTDDRDQLSQRPKQSTILGLARAFRVDPDVVLLKVGEAMGIPVERAVVTYDASRVSDEELLRLLAHRLKREEVVGNAEHPAPMNETGAPPATGINPEDLMPEDQAHGPDEYDDPAGTTPANSSNVRPLRAGDDADTTGVPPMPEDLAAMEGEPGNPPDTTTGEHGQDPGP
ncbi:helix-turn-helix transcriptional regulator [Ruania suaedae]|uniref:helix-turn-helix domain-containing protein n=1 Tax=Ruania suaedae TaxID=2897774 RepID=UPI001E2DED9C|nr:helix-turn-helix transcriptional regulator [Ruania suaedae]UFU03475.1 helix-turn-helix transcriptional regulator [Ruania suaedae]